MGKGIVYVSMSLDGYVAGKKGAMDWRDDFPNPDDLNYGYDDFKETADTILLGKNTYLQILKSKVERAYSDYTVYVMSRDPDLEIKTPNTHSINGLSPETVVKLHAKTQKNIWILGGGLVISQCLEIGAIDEMTICVYPEILGKGIPLFTSINKQMSLTLEKTESFENGIVMLHYKKKEESEE